jgi:hypothetical protein
MSVTSNFAPALRRTGRLASLWILLLSALLPPAHAAEKAPPRRFFSADSFWNQKIPPNAVTHPMSGYWISLLKMDQTCKGFLINIDTFTIPVYQVDETTPRQVVKPLSAMADAAEGRPEGEAVKHIHQHPSFQGRPIPIPEDLAPSPGTDQHVAIVDYGSGTMWDMWYMKRLPDGSWASNTGMITDLNGPGVYTREQVYPYGDDRYVGPGRAAGVPVAAGLIMHHEVRAGAIEHKLAGAVRFVAHGEYIFPPAWSIDGAFPGGIPEGAQIQLDPKLDLSRFDLTPEERVIAKAMQDYGIVIVDFAGASVLYAEGLWYDKKRKWGPELRRGHEAGGIQSIPLDHYRVIQSGRTLRKPDAGKPEHHLRQLRMPRQCKE